MNKKSLSKKIQDILSTATPKQKALLVCKKYTDRKINDKDALLTDEEVEAIRDSLTDGEGETYNKWIRTYRVYTELVTIVGLVYKEYQAKAENLLGYLRQWEAYNQEENHLNTLYQELLDSGNREAIEAFNRAISYLTFVDAKIKRDKEGYIEIDVKHLYEKIQARGEILLSSYEAAKAVVIVTEGYAKKTHSSAFMPDALRTAIEEIKEDYALRVAPRYSRKMLQDKIDRGQRISNDERKRAVFPYYDELKAPQNLIEFFTERLNEITAYEKG